MIKFNSSNNKDLLSDIHKLNKLTGDLSVFKDQDVIMEYVVDRKQRNDFHLTSTKDERSCESLICRICGNDRFIIGQKEYFSALKCPECNYELGIHEG